MASNQPFAYGYVKAVLSGDSMVLLGGVSAQNQLPQEKVVVLSGIQSPKFARSKNSKDEPYAWEAREFLRKLVIGKQVAFRTVAGAGTGREYANVTIDGQNLLELIVKAGYALVKRPPTGGRLSLEKEALVALEETATASGLGIHSKDAPEDHVRSINWNPDAEKLYNKFKGTAVPAVIYQVRDGSTFRCEVQGSLGAPKKGRNTMIVTLSLAGACSPRVPISHDYRLRQHELKKAEDPNYAEDEPEEEQAPAFANEALSFVETRLLHRDVNIKILGLDMSNNVYGAIDFVKGNITTKLLETGFASFIPWTALMTGEFDALKAASQAAQAKKLRLAADSTEAEILPDFTGKVVFVQSGDSLVIDDGEKEVRVSLASIRAPRLGNTRRGQKDDQCAMEAREYLRKRLIGKKVRVQPEYSRANADDRVYATVFHGDVNVGLALTAAGLAETIPHRQEEPRSLHYSKLMEAHLAAKKGLLGKHNPKPTAHQIVDLTERAPRRKAGDEPTEKQAAMTAKARQFLPFLQREKTVSAVVEYCFSGNRFKLLIPKENCMLVFALAGVRCPRSGEDPIGDEALKFIKSKILQQNVRIEVETVDRGDNFLGTVWFGPINLSVALLEKGYAQLQPYSAERSPYYQQMLKAETDAKEAKLKVWENYVEEVVALDTEEENAKGLSDQMTIKVTEVNDATSFYFQVADDEKNEKVEAAMAAFNENVPEPLTEPPAKGAVLAGLYNDDCWYRVKCDGITAQGEMRVTFIDFGNHDILPVANLRALSEDISRLPGLARAAVLAGLKSPTKLSDHFEGSAITFNDMAYDRTLNAKVECVGKDGKVHLTLTDQDEPDITINRILLREGWCRVIERPEWKIKGLCNDLKKDEDFAKNARVNIWEYGDVSDEEEEEVKGGRFDGRTGKPITR